ncbi:MAG: branched-chain-amino-acid transaminase [Nitrospiraceae bacterium]|nr:branched-chain-amino-acid transaminase [Nitrospiraceae bacterium]
MKIYIDGTYHSKDEAKISVFDHGLLYGDGVFEGIRAYDGRVFRLAEHIDRLYASATAVALEIPMAKKEMASAVVGAVHENGTQDGYIRLVVTRGAGSLGLDPSSCGKPTVIIIVGDIQLYPKEYYQKGIRIVTAATRRIPPECLDPRIKSLNYLNNIMAKAEARRAGALEAVMLNTRGYVAECTADNIFIVKDGRLLTPLPSDGALDGITRRAVQELAAAGDIGCIETALTQYDLYTADECFITGTGAEVMPVIGIDDRAIGEGKPGPLTLRLIDAYRKLVAE